jgi:hypothetical protein
VRHPFRCSFTRPTLLAAALLAVLSLPGGAAVKLGTPASETVTGTKAKDAITGDAGDDLLQGLAGDDTYHFADGWGSDTLAEKARYRENGERVPGGADTLSFSGVTAGGVTVYLIPQWRGVDPGYSRVIGSAGDRVELNGSLVENAVGTPRTDLLLGGAGANRLATGGGGNDALGDYGGWDDGPGGVPELPASDDVFAGAGANTGTVTLFDWGGAADVLDLRPLRSDEVYLAGFQCDGDPAVECLQVVTGTGDGQVIVFGQFGAYFDSTADSGMDGRIEALLFADGTVTFGGAKAHVADGRNGEALLGKAETKRQRELAARAPALAEEARTEARRSPSQRGAPGDSGS